VATANVRSIVGKRILITGEVNTGKTILTRVILDELCGLNLSPRIAIVDMAPEIPEEIALQRGLKGVGGKLLTEGLDNILYLAAALKPPRLSSKSAEEALAVAAGNRDKVNALFEAFGSSGRDILFINDVSMYVQAGRAEDLLAYTRSASTIVANGYYGAKLGTGPLSMREAAEMDKLIAAFPYHLVMPEASLDHLLTEIRG
jgi:hypothetical protein